MLAGLESDQRIIQPLALPIGFAVPPAVSVSSQSVNELVMPQVLRRLVGVSTARARRPDQSQAEGVVVGLVRSVFAVGQYRGAPRAACVGQIDPLMRKYFEFLGLRIRALDGSQAQVIGRHPVRGRQREYGFQIRFARIPIDGIRDFKALSRVASRKQDGLPE